ncbi:MAG: response regulator transcription factor [Candidatus Gracilibacteria bacterium]|nr:response regulator transcription factor [Candidatus Gracilibacteria bacterium]
MKILLVEDDKIIGENINEFLSENNFIVNLKTDGQSGLKEALRNKYDLFIFDIMLPYINGIEIIKEIKLNKISTPIILLTAKEDLETMEKGFNSGADDYITKPFSLKELILRIRSLLRRSNNADKLNEITLEGITLNQDLKEITRNGKNIILTPKEFQILEYLMLNKNKVIKKSELVEYIWGINNDIWSDVVRTHITSLRAKINEGGLKDPIITVRGIGFKFETKIN